MNNPAPVYQPPVKLVIVELKLDGEVDHDDVGGLGLAFTRAGLVVGLGRDEAEGGEGGPGEVLAVLQEIFSKPLINCEVGKRKTCSVTLKNLGMRVSSVRLQREVPVGVNVHLRHTEI